MADRKQKRETRADATRSRAREDHEIDEMALHGPKSKWQEADAPAAGDPVSEDEKRGMDLLGCASVRGGAIAGVGEASAESGIDRPTTAESDGPRTNPPMREDTGDTGSTGGVAGGARGNGGTDDRGAGTPRGYMDAGPGEQKSTSRFDLDSDSTGGDRGE